MPTPEGRWRAQHKYPGCVLEIQEARRDKRMTKFDCGTKTGTIFSSPRLALLRSYEDPKSDNLDGGSAIWHSTGVVDDVWISSTLRGRMTTQD